VAFLSAWLLMVGAFSFRSAQAGNRFDFVLWEVRSLPNRWLALMSRPLRRESGDAGVLARYFSSDRTTPDARRAENAAETVIESRIATVLDGLGIGWPLSGVVPGVLPPVDLELAATPQVLVVSPRDRISRERTELLRPDLTDADIEAIERDAEADGMHAALVVPTGGVATYPAIVDTDARYRQAVTTASHEWVHHYLALYPLGRAYFDTGDTRAINETVADVAGDEIAGLALQRFNDVPPPDIEAPETDPRPFVDPFKLLRDLRVEVDSLLAEGRIDEAERRMQSVQEQLATANTSLKPRRINQAYFAWYGTYAARPDSVDPLGDQVRAVRQRAASLAQFLELMRGVQSRAEVERLAVGR
jgi:hypothetical protein